MGKIAARKAAKERKNTFLASCLLVPLAILVGGMISPFSRPAYAVLTVLMGIGFGQMA